MFDLITGREKHLPSHATLPILVSTSAQALVIAFGVVLPALYVTDSLPEVPTMMAFVAAAPAPPPPPPPPAPAPPKPKQAPRPEPSPTQTQLLAPIEEPTRVTEELPDDEGLTAFGVPGGVEGGIPGGVVGGVVGGLPEAPPPPPPPPAPRAPVRIGGQIKQPELVKRVEPVYPPFAVSARIQGVVILEAIVGEDGAVQDVKLLRSANPVIDREALIAVRQWRYSPLVLNGTRVPFILTVTLSFYLEAPK